MPSMFSRKKPAAAAAAAGPSKPARFDFKQMKRDKSGAGSSSSGGGASSGARGDKATSTRMHKAVYQSGENEGKETGNRLFVFNPRKGLNEKAIEKVKELAYGKDDVSGFKKDLNGFTVKVHSPKQAADMHEALRKLDKDVGATLDVGDWSAPEVTVVTIANVDLPETKANQAHEGVTALMLDGYTYPLYKVLRKKLGYDFVHGVHNRDGYNRWTRVLDKGDRAAELEKEVAGELIERGWHVSTAEADAADWEDDDTDREE